jgi:predicted PurR-regulated permease PerM
VIWLAMPVSVGLLLGSLIAFAVEPYHAWLSRQWRRPALAAIVCVSVTMLVIIALLGWLGYLLVVRGIEMARAAQTLFAPDGPVREFVAKVAARFGIEDVGPETIMGKIGEAAGQLFSHAASIGGALASASIGALLGLFFGGLAMYATLRYWPVITAGLEANLPLDPHHTSALLEEYRRVGRGVLLGTVLTGLAQGLLAGIGYWATGVPQAAFFGALTAVASLLPGVGTLLVWVPAGVYLIFTGHTVAGVAELIYGAVVVVGVSDSILRPYLVGDSESTPVILTFIALFGGLELMGLIGLIVGPIVMSLAIAALRIYAAETGRTPASRGSRPRTKS